LNVSASFLLNRFDRITSASNWVKPPSDDPAFAQLVEDASMLVRSKLEEVNRLSNTLRYAEKVRREWEDDFLARHRAMEAAVEASKDRLTSLSSAGAGPEMGDVSSTTSEYAFDADNESYSHPTPVRAASPVPFRPRGAWRSPLIPFNHPSSSHLSISLVYFISSRCSGSYRCITRGECGDVCNRALPYDQPTRSSTCPAGELRTATHTYSIVY
jgi:hypothetical protein